MGIDRLGKTGPSVPVPETGPSGLRHPGSTFQVPATDSPKPAASPTLDPTRTSGGEPVNRPAGGEPVNRPAGGEPVNRPAGGEPVNRPAGGEPVSRAVGVEPVSATVGAEPVGSPALERLRAGDVDLRGYVDLKVHEATRHLSGLPAVELEKIRSVLRERLTSDPSLVDLLKTATGETLPADDD